MSTPVDNTYEQDLKFLHRTLPNTGFNLAACAKYDAATTSSRKDF